MKYFEGLIKYKSTVIRKRGSEQVDTSFSTLFIKGTSLKIHTISEDSRHKNNLIFFDIDKQISYSVDHSKKIIIEEALTNQALSLSNYPLREYKSNNLLFGLNQTSLAKSAIKQIERYIMPCNLQIRYKAPYLYCFNHKNTIKTFIAHSHKTKIQSPYINLDAQTELLSITQKKLPNQIFEISSWIIHDYELLTSIESDEVHNLKMEGFWEEFAISILKKEINRSLNYKENLHPIIYLNRFFKENPIKKAKYLKEIKTKKEKENSEKGGFTHLKKKMITLLERELERELSTTEKSNITSLFAQFLRKNPSLIVSISKELLE